MRQQSAPATAGEITGLSPCAPAKQKRALPALFYYFVFAIVFMHFEQTFIFLPSIFLDCRLIFCLFKVLILECERLASLVAPRAHKSHFVAMLF